MKKLQVQSSKVKNIQIQLGQNYISVYIIMHTSHIFM